MKRYAHKILSLAALVEPLERRTLLSLSPIGGEFPVNSVAGNAQQVPSVASDAEGDFVVVWEGNGPGDNSGVFARRYNAAGAALGAEFRVNSTTDGFQGQSAVAMDADGDFVVVWGGNGPGDNAGVFAQRFDALGVAQGGEFRVNAATNNGQGLPAVAMDATGNFVIAWTTSAFLNQGQDISFRLYSASGVPRSNELLANERRILDQNFPSVAMAADGRFVIAWTDNYATPEPGGSAHEVYCKRFFASGVPFGSEFHVNTFTTGSQGAPSVATDANFDFVVTWHSDQQDGPSNFGVFGQRYSSSGAPQGGEFRVNTTTATQQLAQSVAMDADGEFFVAWTSYGQDGSNAAIYGRHFNSAGVPQADEFRVNTFTINDQRNPAVAMNVDGDAVVVWQSNLQDGSGEGVYAQRFDESTEAAGPALSGLSVELNPIAPGERVVQSVPALVLNFSEQLSVIGGTSGSNSATNPANYTLTRNGVDASGLITSANFGLNAASGKHQTTLNFSVPLPDGDYVVTARQSLRDLAGNPLDGNLDGVPGGGDASIAFSVLPPVNVGPEARANAFTANVQSLPAVAMDADGDYVVVWQSNLQDGSAAGIFAQLYNDDGQPRGAEFRVNTFTTGFQARPAVAMEAGGDFVVAWDGNGNGDTNGIFARRYSGSGLALGGEFRVNGTTADGQSGAAVAMDREGGFVVAWDGNGPGDTRGIFAQRYNAAGVAQGGEFRVNTHTASTQQGASVGMDADGDFVVGWNSYLQDGSASGAYAQRYNSDGVAQGGEFRVNNITIGAQVVRSVAMHPGGEFLIVWNDVATNPDSDGIFVQRYSATGQGLGGSIRAHTTTVGGQNLATVAIDATGDFVVAWRSLGQDAPAEPTNGGIYAQRFNAKGGKEGPEFRVNSITTGSQTDPSVAMSAAGDFVVVWEGNGTGDADGVFAQRYGPNEAPTTLGIAAVNVPQNSADTVINLRTAFDDSTDPDDRLTFSIVGNTNPALFDATPVNNASGTLTLDYAAGGSGQAMLTVRCTDTRGLFAETSFLVTVIPLSVNNSQFLFATAPHRLSFAFNDNVSASLAVGDVVLQNLTTGATIPSADLSLAYDAGTDTATFSYTGSGSGITGVLPDGNYRATLLGAGITNPGGTPMPANHVFDFFFLNGDANHDGRVNLQDFSRLATNFGQSNRTFDQGDFNYDTIVNLRDFSILASRFGQALAAGASTGTPAAAPQGIDSLRDLLEELK